MNSTDSVASIMKKINKKILKIGDNTYKKISSFGLENILEYSRPIF